MAARVFRINKNINVINRNIFYNLIRGKNVWSHDNVISSPFKDIILPEMTINKFVFRDLDKWPNKIATVCGITNRSYTFEQMYKNTQIFGANLRKKFKLNDGDAVGIISHNIPEYPIMVLGALAAGCIVSTFNPEYTPYEVHSQILLSEVKLIIAHPDSVTTAKEAIKLCKKQMPIISVDIINTNKIEGTVSYRELVEDKHVDLGVLKSVKTNKDDVSLLPYSSGTTGLPKGVELTHRSIVVNCAQQDSELRQYALTTDNNQENQLLILPLFHAYGLILAMIHKLSAGIKIVTLPSFKPETFLDTMINQKISLMYLVPPLVLFLASHPKVTSKYFEYINTIVCGAAPLPRADIENLLRKAKREFNFSQGYGMTEAGPLVSIHPPGSKDYVTSGYILPNVKTRVVNDKMTNLGPNQIGELLVKSPSIMKGYKNNPEANKQVFVDGNWLRSGDMASVDELGKITIVDRLKELIKVKGYQVAPAELENLIKQHPAVLDCAVIGIPDLFYGERPKAYIVLKDREEASDNIMNFANEKVTSFKKLKEVTFVKSIPKSASGKILRRILKEAAINKK